MIYFNGSTGGLGRHLGPLLERRGVPHRVLNTRIGDADTLASELDALSKDPGSTAALIHLAAMVSVPRCEENPDLARAVNVDGAVRYVENFVRWTIDRGSRPAVVYVSSGHVYAPPAPGHLIPEDGPVEPRSVYAQTKLEAETELAGLSTTHGFPLTVSRVFGLIAPGQPPHYLLPALIERVRKNDVARVPGLSNVRDYLDARDVVGLLHDLAEWSLSRAFNETTTVNVCSGMGVSIRDVLDAVIDAVSGVDTSEAEAIRRSVSEAPGRPTDVAWLVGSPAKLQEITSSPTRSISLEKTVRDAVTTS